MDVNGVAARWRGGRRSAGDGIGGWLGGVSIRGMSRVASDTGDGADSRGERGNIVEHSQRDEMVGPTCVVLAGFTAADQNAVAGRHSELTDLNVNGGVVQGHFAGNGDARPVRAQAVAARWQGKFCSELL